MTVTARIKILDRKIMQNEAQYDLDRKAAKISALPSNNLGKYEYLTGEDLGLKPSTLEQAKFEYSPLGKVFNRGLDDKDDKKEGLLKTLKNIEDENEKLPNALSEAIKPEKNVRSESGFYYNSTYNFCRFYRDFGKFKKMASLDSKRSELIKFLNFLETLKILSPLVMIQKNLKIRLWIKFISLIDTLMLTKKDLIVKIYTKTIKIFFDPNQYKILSKKKQKLEQTEKLRENLKNHYGLK